MDPRLERTRGAILDAVTQLIEQHALSTLSITQVANAAGITRPTFYQQFADVPSAARAAAFARLDEAMPLGRPVVVDDEPAAETIERVRCEVLPMLEYLEANRTFFVRVMEEAGTAGFFDDLVTFIGLRISEEPMVPANASPELKAASNRFVAAGLSWLVINWLRAAQRPSRESVAEQIGLLVSRLISKS